tara:strand:+ start:83237 stop:84484 length:1248 start_codon:yes stop_codon:yes gene_type:complete
MKIKESKLRSAIKDWLFEYNTDSGVSHRASTDDKVAGTLGDTRKEDIETTVPSPQPIIALDQTSTQLQKDLPPVEDPDWVPTCGKELSAAAEALASGIPDSEREFFYNELMNLREKAIEQGNKPDLQDLFLGDKDIDVPIKSVKENRKRKLKNRVALKRTGYITNVTNKNRSVMPEARYGARQRDAARKWKQGDDLNLYRPDDDYSELDDEWVPDVDDIRDFMEETGEHDPTKVAGYRPEMATAFGLEDIVASNVYPSVKGPSGITNKLEREIYPILRATKNAPQLTDRLNSLVRSEFARDAFYEAMLFSKLLDQEHIDDLKKDENALMDSEMFKYMSHQAIIIPAMKELAKLKRAGVYDPLSKKSQLSPEEADAVIEKIKKRWNGMTKARKANDARKAMQSNLEFLQRDTSVMG